MQLETYTYNMNTIMV